MSNSSPEVDPIDTKPEPVSDAITGFIIVVIGCLGIWGMWALYAAFRGAA